MHDDHSTRCRDCGARINMILHPTERCSHCQLDRDLEHTTDPIHRAHLQRFIARYTTNHPNA